MANQDPAITRYDDLLARAKKPAADALRLHPYYRGKIQTAPKAPIRSLADFAIWYTPEKDDVHVDIRGDLLTVRGEKKKEEKIEERDYYCHERAYGAFSRSIRLPVEVQGEKASATFKHGVLEMHLPKTEAAKRRSVSIKVE